MFGNITHQCIVYFFIFYCDTSIEYTYSNRNTYSVNLIADLRFPWRCQLIIVYRVFDKYYC